MSSILLVEGTSDKAFIEILIERLIDLHPQSNSKIDCQVLEGIDSLVKKLKQVKDDTEKLTEEGSINKIGIILDLDSVGTPERLTYINTCLEGVFLVSEPLTQAGIFTTAKNQQEIDLQIGCYFMGINDAGELETVLKKIKRQDSPYADCLEAWRKCLMQRDCQVSQKEFDKFWINNYIRLDTCSKKDQKQRDKKCNPEKLDEMIRKENIWDLEHECLTGLKNFLSLFLEN